MSNYRNETYFNEYEIKAMKPVLTRLGVNLADMKREEVSHILEIVYSLPHAGRADIEKVIAGLQISMQALGTFLRYEMQAHSNSMEFRQRVLRAVNGDPQGFTLDQTNGLRGMLGQITLLTGEAI